MLHQRLPVHSEDWLAGATNTPRAWRLAISFAIQARLLQAVKPLECL